VETQERVYVEQLKLAQEFELPVILHVRRSQDRLLKYLRQVPVSGGLAHAFNGSEQQASRFIAAGFALGFGGAMTFARALQIRRLAASVSAEAFVLETDSPDMAPEWINRERNDPGHLPKIAEVMAQLRGIDVETVIAHSTANARRCLPRLAHWLDRQASDS
ncbi:MAG: TatD family hydrolase, partial [Burkholderiaceae bacterium]